MEFGPAVTSALSKYANFSGRASRSEFWWFFVFNILVQLPATIIDVGILHSDNDVVGSLLGLALLLPNLAVGARRLHDTGRSGWWQLLGLIPLIGAIVLIVWFCMAGHDGSNEYGANPLQGGERGDRPSPPSSEPPPGAGPIVRN